MSEPEAVGKARILYVEDEEDLLFLIAKRLEWEGFSVEKAMTCEQALAALKKSRPDLMILDLMLPDGSGLGILDFVRSEEALADLPVIILTGIGHTEAVEDGFVAGTNAYLTKPVTTERLLEAVNIILAEK